MSLPQSSTSNLLLKALTEGDYALLAPDLERTTIPFGTVLFERNELVEQVYFLEAGVASVISEQEGGEQIEIGLYGRDGMSGTAVILHAGRSPQRSLIQVGDGVALAIESGRLLAACASSPTLYGMLLRYVQAMIIQAAMTAASNAHYELPERLARWLLMCHDRVDGDRLEMTHEFISMMLAVRRSGVTVTLHTLEATGAIRASRGIVTVTNRPRLEEIAGDSYGEPEEEYRRLIGPFGKTKARPLS